MDTALNPQQIQKVFGEYFAAADIDGLLSLYRPDAIFTDPTGRQHVGDAAIRAQLQSLLDIPNVRFELRTTHSFITDRVALLHGAWEIRGGDAENEIAMSGTSIEVVEKQPDGTWLYVIDNPFGIASGDAS